MHPELLTAGNGGPQADIATVLERVRDAYPRGRLAGVDAPTTVRPTHLAYVTEDGRFRTVLIDPVTTRVLGELPDRSVVRTLQDLHFDLLAGPTGRVVNGVGALCLLLLCISGLFIWWPGRAGWRRGFTVDWRRPWKRVTWELHGAVGIWTLVLTAGWAVTGAYFVFPAEFRGAVNRISPLTVVSPPQSNPDGADSATHPTSREMVDLARRTEPGAFVARVVLPATDEAPFRVLFTDRRPTPLGARHLRTVYLDRYSGERLVAPAASAPTPGDTVMAWIGPLHFGNFGGPGIRAVWLVAGLAPGLLAATGLILWWTRAVAPRRRRRRVPEAAAPGGGQRNLEQPGAAIRQPVRRGLQGDRRPADGTRAGRDRGSAPVVAGGAAHLPGPAA